MTLRPDFSAKPTDDRPAALDPANWSHGANVADIRGAILSKIVLTSGKDVNQATKRDWYIAAVLTLRDRIVHRWLQSQRELHKHGTKQVFYLSLEFLIGRLFTDALANLSLMQSFRSALEDLGISLDELKTIEPDAALGNGG